MEGASLPSLIAPPTLTAASGSAPAAAADPAAADGFATILGATELTGLTAEQQAALRQLLAHPGGARHPVDDHGGKVLPHAAIRGLLHVLGIDLGRPGVEKGFGPATDDRALRDAASSADDGADLASVLAVLLAAGATIPQQSAGPATAPAASSRAGQEDDVKQTPASLASLLAAADRDGGSGAADSPGLVKRAWVLAQRWPGLPGVAEQSRDPAAPAVDPVHPRAVRPVESPGPQIAPAAPVAPRAVQPPAVESAMLAAPLAAVEPVPDERHAASLVADLARAVASTTETTSPALARSAATALAEVVPPHAARGPSAAVSIPVGERGWERAFGERVVWLVGQQVQAAEVRLNPPHLGPVEVRLSLTGQDASVSFTVSHAATRDAIEQAIPRLRDLFAEHQLQIVNVDVGQRDAASQASQDDRWRSAGRPSTGPEARLHEVAPEAPARSRLRGLPGLVDEYV